MRSQGRGQSEDSRSVGGEGGVQRAECDVIIRVGGVRRARSAGSAGAQGAVSPQEKTAEATGQTAKRGRKPR